MDSCITSPSLPVERIWPLPGTVTASMASSSPPTSDQARPLADGGAPVLLRTEMVAGHGGRSGRYDAWRDRALELAFLLTHIGSPGNTTILYLPIVAGAMVLGIVQVSVLHNVIHLLLGALGIALDPALNEHRDVNGGRATRVG